MQLGLFPNEDIKTIGHRKNGTANRLNSFDRHFHDWYRFVLSFPPHLVREYITKFGLNKNDTILDPFCGTGTTLVEAKLFGVSSIGIEANIIAHFASSVKVDWNIDPDGLLEHATYIAKEANRLIISENKSSFRTLPIEVGNLLLKGSISPKPLHKSLILLEQIQNNESSCFKRHELLALAKILVFSASNLYFGPEVGVRQIQKQDAPVIESWLAEVKKIALDLHTTKIRDTIAIVHHADSRQFNTLLGPKSISAVFTSPPYPNEKDYTRTTRLESVLLGFIRNKEELRNLKKGLLRSNTRNVYKGDNDDEWIADNAKIQAIASEIERRRVSLGKTSGFERLYSKVTKLYFGGMAQHLAELRPFLKSGANLGYVVGDQASYLQVMIRTGQLLAEIAQSLGYRVMNIDLFRTRTATVTGNQMREEVVILQWPG